MNKAESIPLPTENRFEEWRQNWPLLFCSAVGATMAMMAVGSLGVFLPIQRDLGWSRTQISAGFTIYAIIGAVGAPVVGRFIDRFGARKIGMAGAIGEGIAFALFALITKSVVSWFLVWIVFSIATQGTRPVVWTAAISATFDKGRGLAMALVFVGLSIGHFISPILADRLIDFFGWRSAYVIMGIGWGGLISLFCYLFFHPRLPAQPQANVSDERHDGTALQLRPILTSRPFILLAVAMFFGNALNMAFSVHMVPLLVWRGMPPSEAALLVGISALGASVGTLVCGTLVMRFQGSVVAGLVALGPVISCTLFLLPHDGFATRILPVLFIGFIAGAQTHLFAYLVSRYFDLRVYGTIYGILSAVAAVAVGVGPLVGGLIFDNFKSYHPMIIGAIPVALLISLLLFLLGRPKTEA